MSETAILAESQDKIGLTVEPDYQDVLKLQFEKLHREYRSLENRRHAIAHRDGYVQKRTTTIMPMLEHDHAELRYEIQNATCRAHTRKATHLAANMKEALKTFDLYQQEISKKMKQIAEIERHVDRITDKVIKQRVRMLASHGLSKSLAQWEQEVTKAENKLYHYTCAFNMKINENKSLRDEIMDFLIDRGQFFKMHNSLKRQIGRTKKEMLSIVQQAIGTYDNRDEAMSKVKALRERETKELKQHGMEIQEFERTLHHDKTILEFIKTKLKKRSDFEDAVDRRIRLSSAKEKELDSILRKYRRSFKKILSYSHTNSILDLVDMYNKLDGDNFENVRHITDLNNECEMMKEATENLKSKIEDVHTEVERKEREHRNTQQNLQLEIIKEQEQIDAKQRQLRSNKTKQRDIFGTIAAALMLAQCSTAPIMQLLGNREGITEHNVRLCITQLDIKITELKSERDRLRELKHHYDNVNVSSNILRSALGKPKVQPQPTQAGPFVPKMVMYHGDNADDEDLKIFEQEPYFYDEMKDYVIEKAIEEKILDPAVRSRTAAAKAIRERGHSSSISIASGANDSRKSLVQKYRLIEMEPGYRRHRRHTHEIESKISGKTESSDRSESNSARKKTQHIVKLGEDLHVLVKESAKAHPELTSDDETKSDAPFEEEDVEGTPIEGEYFTPELEEEDSFSPTEEY